MKNNKKEIKELKDKIAKATLKKKDKKVKKLNKKLQILIQSNKAILNDKSKKEGKHTLINKQAKKRPKKQAKTKNKVSEEILTKKQKTIIEKRNVNLKKAISAPKVDNTKIVPTSSVPVKETVKPKPVYDAVINYGAAKNLEADHHRVGDIIEITDLPLDNNKRKIKINLGRHTIVPAPGKYLNTYMGVFVNDKANKPVYIHFPYFKETPFTNRES